MSGVPPPGEIQRPSLIPTGFPGPLAPMTSLWSHPHLTWQLTRQEILARYRGSILGLLWSFTQYFGISGLSMFFFVLFVASATMLFGTVFWSKFAHMFFKPAAAYQKKVAMADGSRENLPDDYDLTDPAVQAKFPDIPEYLGTNPPNMDDVWL